MSGRRGSRSGGRPTTRSRPSRISRSCSRGGPAAGSSSGRRAGVEHDWGEVTVWEPPRRLVYLWHLSRDRADATEVEIRFARRGDAATLVEIEHRGWEGLGAEGEDWRDRNHGGWATLLPHYIALVAASANEAMSG